MTKLQASVPLLAVLIAAAPVPHAAPPPQNLPQDLRAALSDPSDLAATCADFAGIREGQAPAAERPALRRAQSAWLRRLDRLLPKVEADQSAGSTVNVLMNGNSTTQIATAARWCVAHQPR